MVAGGPSPQMVHRRKGGTTLTTVTSAQLRADDAWATNAITIVNEIQTAEIHQKRGEDAMVSTFQRALMRLAVPI